MKIIQMLPTLGSGGAERFVVDLSNELYSCGHEIILCTLYDLKEKEEYSFFDFELSKEIKRYSLSKKLGFDIQQFYKLYKFIKGHKPDVVHSHLSVINYLLLSVLFFNKVKFVHTLHSDASKLIKNKYEKFLRMILYFKLKRIIPICISEESKNSFVKLYKAKENIEIIYNGRVKQEKTSLFSQVEEELAKIMIQKDCILLNIGRFSEEKNQLELVKAVYNINKNTNFKVKLLLIGGGKAKIEKELRKYESDNIIFLGKKRNISDYMMLSDAFILPSIYEGMPMSVIEAMSMGKPILVSHVGGLINMIHNNGLFINGSKHKDIEKTILNFLEKTIEEKEKMKKYSIELYKSKYSISKCMNRYLDIYGK